MCKHPVACLHANKELPKDVTKKRKQQPQQNTPTQNGLRN